MPIHTKNHATRVTPDAEAKMKWLMALNRALSCEIDAQTKTPALMKAAGVKNVNA
ncbi:hypothetical protein [Pseudomonas sp. NA-150]|uniref:hypothetical protein n=1 Tax=Pseudomonas sp. NA-150 TaxID=3367525 RepID=UPI0037CC6AED